MFKYYIIYKPFGMLSQFSPEGSNATLKDLDYYFPKDVYPVGRLDADSEGLLILTNDISLNKRLLDPEEGHWRTYLVQVEGKFTVNAKKQIEHGVEINVNGKFHKCKPAQVRIPDNIPNVPDRFPPVRFRKSIPTSWIYITLTEGKNRQVRKMTAKAGFPTLRLIRVSIGNLVVTDMIPGQVLEVSKKDII